MGEKESLDSNRDLERLRSRVVGRGRNYAASLLSKEVLHWAAIMCHLCHEPGLSVLFSALLK